MNATTTTHRPAPRAAASARPLEFGERLFVPPLSPSPCLSLSVCASLPRVRVTRARRRSVLENSQQLSRQRRSGRAKEICDSEARNFRFCVACFFFSPPPSSPFSSAFQTHAHTHTHDSISPSITLKRGRIRAPVVCKVLRRRGAEKEGGRS